MSGERQSPAQPASTWLSRPERGALLGMRARFWIATALGRGNAAANTNGPVGNVADWPNIWKNSRA